MPYKEYLKTPEWQATRKAAIKRAGYRCQLCNRTNVPLDVHHRTYERLGEELKDDVIALCNDDHAKFHGIMEVQDGND
jgi:5-methylcytosine-specific restriction endonuclease McrA